MYYKMAFTNVRKSLKDFTIYFVTLTLGVCLFYVFNSVESQKALLTLSSSQIKMIDLMNSILSGVSVFISFVLAFLILYANSFLIKRRKKELGLYMLLGMEKGQISRILLYETFFIGLFSLITGLIVGILASQGMSIITASMFVVDMEEFHFIFSGSAFLKTILYFGIIYLFVILFNNLTISKYSIIDLINAGKKVEKRRLKSLWLQMILFFVSLACIIYAYYLIRENRLLELDGSIVPILLLGIIGTFLFFYSLSGLLLKAIRACRGVYYKGLNMFVLRQINAKITTTFVSLSVICLLLFFSITILSSGIGAALTMSADLEELTPYDATFTAYAKDKGEENLKEIEDTSYSEWLLKKMQQNEISGADKIENANGYTLYNLEGETSDKLYTYIDENKNIPDVTKNELSSQLINFMKLSDYNRLLQQQGIQEVSLEENEILINCQTDQMMPTYELLSERKGSIHIQGAEYTIKDLQDTVIETTTMKVNWGFVVINDEVIEGGIPYSYAANYRYEMTEAEEQQWDEEMERLNNEGEYFYMNITKTGAYEQQAGLAAVCAYLAIYLGLIFLISCSAIIALQQLSESSDNVERYALLRKLGTDERDIHRSLFMQVGITFLVPLSLAIVHSAVAVPILNNLVEMFGLDASAGIIAAICGILLVYGGYMMVTYYAGRGMIDKRS